LLRRFEDRSIIITEQIAHNQVCLFFANTYTPENLMQTSLSANDTFGQRISRLRRSNSMTQEQLAKKSELSLPLIRMLEQGRRCNPTLDTLLKLCRAMNLTLIDLLGHDGLHVA